MEDAVTRQVGQGHVIIVGNPLPIPALFRPLPFAEKEAEIVEDTPQQGGCAGGAGAFLQGEPQPQGDQDSREAGPAGCRVVARLLIGLRMAIVVGQIDAWNPLFVRSAFLISSQQQARGLGASWPSSTFHKR
jgi:hypothetical protein